MPALTLEVRAHSDQTEFNLRRWEELQADPGVNRLAGRVETDRHGRLIMSPPPAPQHGELQFKIGFLLKKHKGGGHVITECAISTADGVKAADVAWASDQRWAELGKQRCFLRAPEICVEVLSPGNTEEEIREKILLYGKAGAQEVWVCSEFGLLSFFGPEGIPLNRSELCPAVPLEV